MTKENGKTLDEARGEVRRAIENVEVGASIPSLLMGYNVEDVAQKLMRSVASTAGRIRHVGAV